MVTLQLWRFLGDNKAERTSLLEIGKGTRIIWFVKTEDREWQFCPEKLRGHGWHFQEIIWYESKLKGRKVLWPSLSEWSLMAGSNPLPFTSHQPNLDYLLISLRYHLNLPLHYDTPQFLFHLYFYTVILQRFWDILTDMLTVVIVPNAYWHVKHVLMSLYSCRFQPGKGLSPFFSPFASGKPIIFVSSNSAVGLRMMKL